MATKNKAALPGAGGPIDQVQARGQAAQPAGGPGGRKGVLGLIAAPLFRVGDVIRGFFKPRSGAAAGQGPVVWRSHVPELARRMADVIDVEPRLFRWLGFGAAALRDLDGEVQVLTQVRSFLGGLTELVDGLLNERRTELYHKTAQVKQGIDGVLGSPLTPPDVKEDLERVSRPIYDMLGERRQKIRAVRRKNRREADAAAEEVAGLERENQVLRGKTPGPG